MFKRNLCQRNRLEMAIESKKHHYIPRFILKKWKVNGFINGYYWNKHNNEISINRSGPGGFGFENFLLSIDSVNFPSDIIETHYFKTIDNNAAKIINKLLDFGPKVLTDSEKIDFAKLILSFGPRYPENVKFIRALGPSVFENEFSDEESIEVFRNAGVVEKPSEWLKNTLGINFENQSMLAIPDVINSSSFRPDIENWNWQVYQLGELDNFFVMGDRPLLRMRKTNFPIWALPLTPRHLLMIMPPNITIGKSLKQKLRESVNRQSVSQAKKYVFMIDDSNINLLKKHLPRK